MDTAAARAGREPPALSVARKPVTLPREEGEQLRGAGWTEAQLAAGKRQVARPCRRCGGSGDLSGLGHVEHGRCVRCHAVGVDPRPATEYAPSVRAELDERAARRRKAKAARLHAAFDGWLGQRPEVAAVFERADADLRAWEAWDGCVETPTGVKAPRPRTPLVFDPFLAELTRRLRRREALSDGEAEYYVRRVAELTRQNERERELEARRVPAPEGTVTFSGTIATIRSQPGYMGRAERKILVLATTTDGDGEFRVWCTVPRRGGPLAEGDRITLTAALRRSDNDPSFAFGKRSRLTTSRRPR